MYCLHPRVGELGSHPIPVALTVCWEREPCSLRCTCMLPRAGSACPLLPNIRAAFASLGFNI